MHIKIPTKRSFRVYETQTQNNRFILDVRRSYSALALGDL